MTVDLTPFLDAERLLRKYGFELHADIVMECHNAIIRDGLSVFDRVATIDWWGGAGSIADVYLIGPGGLPSEERPDNRKLRSALIKVYDLMVRNGVTLERATFWAETFREWERKGV